MDDFRDEDGLADKNERIVLAIVAVAHAVGLWLLCQYCWPHCCLCCRSGQRPANGHHLDQPDLRVHTDRLQEKKRTLTSYVLWLFAGLFGTHHFYLGRVVHGLLAAWSLNFFAIGWIADAFLLPGYVRRHNSQHAEDFARYDSSRGTVLFKVPAVVFTGLLCLVGLFLYAPTMLHAAGVLDLERLSSQTSVNPYDVLEIDRHASSHELKMAYRKASLEWHPDRNLGCGEVCEKRMSDITKAFKYIKETREPSVERTWRSSVKVACGNWLHVFDALQSASDSTASRDGVKVEPRGSGKSMPRSRRSES